MEDEKTELRRILYVKYYDARMADKMWDASNYEWEMGTDVAYLMGYDNRLFYFEDTQTYYDIPIRINHKYPFKIQLWKKV